MGNLLFWLGIGAAQKGAGSKPIERRHRALSFAVALGHRSDVVIGLGSRGAIGVNEQLFGAIEQVRGQGQCD